MPSFNIKGGAETVAPVLASIFNYSRPAMEYPRLWKVAGVIPISKKDPTELSKFWPVYSQYTDVIPSILEQIMCKYV